MIKKHPLLFFYLVVISLVLTGLVYGFGLKHVNKVLVYLFFFGASYFFFYKYFKKHPLRIYDLKIITRENKFIIDLILLVFVYAFVAYHLFFLGHVPFLSAFKILDYYKIALIRQSIIEHDNSFIKYLSAFLIKGFIPFLLLYFFITHRRFFYFLLPIAVFYAISLMQKSLIVSIMIPLIIYLVVNKQYLKACFSTIVSITGVFVLVYTTNPSLRATQEEIRAELLKNGHVYLSDENDKSMLDGFMSASDAVYTRVVVTTGLVAGYWFDNIPSVYPYAKGCGYHFLAPLLGCNFENYDFSRIIYDATYKKEAKIGLKGTVTVTSFVYDYANFGWIGLMYSGILLALFFVFIQQLFNNNFRWIVSFNTLFILWLSSGSFFTQLLSGGWLLTLFLFFIFRNTFSLSEKNAP